MRSEQGAARRWALVVAMCWWVAGCAMEKSAEVPPLEVETAVAHERAAQDEFGISHGEVDVANRYRSVVSVRIGKRSCSGALVAPRLVLTAAHCFCEPHARSTTIIDSSNCAREVAVLSYFYRRVKGGWLPGKDVVPGQVIVNESFRSEIDERWLVGINGGYVSQGATESWFTSTFSHRKWIEEQIAAARKLESQ